MFQSGVPEKIIQERTGHRSLAGLRQYERATIEQQRAVCQVLASDKSETIEICSSALQKSVATPSVSTLHPQMNFTGCSVAIYQGSVTGAVGLPPLPPPPPPLPPPVVATPQVPELLDFDLDTFLSDF